MSKQVSFTKEKVLEGLRIAAKAVGDTIGPRGQNTFMGGGIPRITNDGFTVATAILFEDPEIDLGAYIVRNVTGQQNDDVGDGTTTVSILTASIIEESLKRPENPVLIKDSLKEAGDKILKQLAKTSIKIEQKDVEKVALISSENKNLARIISEITGKLGEKAVINVEDSKTFATYFELPELNHHLMEGLKNPATNKKNLLFILLNSNLYLPRNQKRYKILKNVLAKNKIRFVEYSTKSKTKFLQSFETLIFGSYLSFYLAMDYNLDPSPFLG